jgi:hypothetical protein
MRLSSNTVYGFVTGTVLASVMLAVEPASGTEGRPLYTMNWIALSAVVTTVTRSYGLHVSTHESDSDFWPDLGKSMGLGWPIMAACVPTLLLVFVAMLAHWPDDHLDAGIQDGIGYTSAGLFLNVVLLFGWGIAAACNGGYPLGRTLSVGSINALLGLTVVAANLAVR